MMRRIISTFASAFALAAALSISATGSADARVVIQKTTIYINTLPKGCVKTVYPGGTVVWKCGTIYYMPVDTRYVRVYIR